ncbi:transglutaminase-like cysteine peptidase [Thermodesulfobacteriota bacterium]
MVKRNKRIKPLLWICSIVAGLAIVGPVITKENFHINRKILKTAENKYGKDAVERLVAWENFIRQDNSSSDMDKLEKTNRFFNEMIMFVNDIDLWGVKDYWATPLEFLCRRAGDCEDFAIAKYFTLAEMGIPEKKLNILYVKALRYNQAHMVLTYLDLEDSSAEPLVLDNLVDSIEPSSKRTDLLPVFSFNDTGLWLAKQRGRGKFVGSSDRIDSWKDLLRKMIDKPL